MAVRKRRETEPSRVEDCRHDRCRRAGQCRRAAPAETPQTAEVLRRSLLERFLRLREQERPEAAGGTA